MGARKIAYCEMEGGLFLPWSQKPWGYEPPYVFWADGKIKDPVLKRLGRARKFTRKEALRIEKVSFQNFKKCGV